MFSTKATWLNSTPERNRIATLFWLAARSSLSPKLDTWLAREFAPQGSVGLNSNSLEHILASIVVDVPEDFRVTMRRFRSRAGFRHEIPNPNVKRNWTAPHTADFHDVDNSGGNRPQNQ